MVDWLDACRSGDINALLDLYDEQAVLECTCEGASLTGRDSLSSYWAGKRRDQPADAFTLDDMTVTEDGVWVDYRNDRGNPVRAHFRFSSSGKIKSTSCKPL
ncbi:nuclear transport factor 2 family protein [Bradyrhizobium sp. LjRoot220]|uniref:nuclear transport factor 2 family protein n=1 Tax=Bradyrhizobium sp. LjRoot220 TaxID=3342284 RepID=UPI003ECCC6CF